MTKSLISLTFKKCRKEKRPALLTYTVAGDSSKKKSLEILNSISNHADIVELGFPHNTPIADGGQIQTSSYRAIQKGIKMKDVFQIVAKFKKNKKVVTYKCSPLVRFENLNSYIFQFDFFFFFSIK